MFRPILEKEVLNSEYYVRHCIICSSRRLSMQETVGLQKLCTLVPVHFTVQGHRLNTMSTHDHRSYTMIIHLLDIKSWPLLGPQDIRTRPVSNGSLFLLKWTLYRNIVSMINQHSGLELTMWLQSEKLHIDINQSNYAKKTSEPTQENFFKKWDFFF